MLQRMLQPVSSTPCRSSGTKAVWVCGLVTLSLTPFACSLRPLTLSLRPLTVSLADSLLKTFRVLHPHMLRKKDRGRKWKLEGQAQYGRAPPLVCLNPLVALVAVCRLLWPLWL